MLWKYNGYNSFVALTQQYIYKFKCFSEFFIFKVYINICIFIIGLVSVHFGVLPALYAKLGAFFPHSSVAGPGWLWMTASENSSPFWHNISVFITNDTMIDNHSYCHWHIITGLQLFLKSCNNSLYRWQQRDFTRLYQPTAKANTAKMPITCHKRRPQKTTVSEVTGSGFFGGSVGKSCGKRRHHNWVN